MNVTGFEVRLTAFSGPLDLLCCLVESSEVDPAKISLTELMSQYVMFLLENKRTTINEMAEFFSFASRILLRKVKALFPSNPEDDQEMCDSEEISCDPDEELMRMLEAFRPYRAAAAYLSKLQSKRERCFIRVTDEESRPFYDIGDLYSLASKWWELLDRYNERKKDGSYESDFVWDDIPDAVPEERQVEQRMDELLQQVRGRSLMLKELLCERNRKTLIVTLLALLEMSRLGWVRLSQNEGDFGDVRIETA